MKRGSRRATIQLKGAIIGIDDEDDCTFTIRDQTRTFHFQGESVLRACITPLHALVLKVDSGGYVHVLMRDDMYMCIHALLHSSAAQDSKEREKWVQALEACIRRMLLPPMQVTTHTCTMYYNEKRSRSQLYSLLSVCFRMLLYTM